MRDLRIISLMILAMIAVLINSCGYRSQVYQIQLSYQRGNTQDIYPFLDSQDPYARLEAVRSLILLGECSNRILLKATDLNPKVRAVLAENLIKCNNRAALETLLILSDDKNAMVKLAVIESAIQNDFCKRDCYFALRGLLNDRDKFVCLRAAKALYNRFPDEAHSIILDALTLNSIIVQREAIEIMPLFGRQDDIYYLGEFLSAKDKTLRMSARKSIEKIMGRPLSGTEFIRIKDGDTLQASVNPAPKSAAMKPAGSQPVVPHDKPKLSDFQIDFHSQTPRRDDIAIIIGNNDYASVDIPDVEYALRDARIMRELMQNVLGVVQSNIYYVENAKMSDFQKIFGTAQNHRGLLWNWSKTTSRIYIYYSGHGAPEVMTKSAYFVPVDSDINYINLSGYSLDLFYKNLGLLNAESVIIILDTCFSGITNAGAITKSASPIYVSITDPDHIKHSANMTILSSSRHDQISSWDELNRFGLFTYHFIKSIAEGDADGNGDLTINEIETYISEKVPYFARRLLNRDQHPQVVGNRDTVLIRNN